MFPVVLLVCLTFHTRCTGFKGYRNSTGVIMVATELTLAVPYNLLVEGTSCFFALSCEFLSWKLGLPVTLWTQKSWCACSAEGYI